MTGEGNTRKDNDKRQQCEQQGHILGGKRTRLTPHLLLALHQPDLIEIIRRVQDLNLRAGISRFDGFRVRCITTLPTLQNTRTSITKQTIFGKLLS